MDRPPLWLTAGLPALGLFGLGSALVTIPRDIPRRRLAEPARLPPTPPGTLALSGVADAQERVPGLGGVRASGPSLGPGANGGVTGSFIGAVGIVESASEEITLAPRLAGVVVEVDAVAGQPVAVGTPLFRIDPRSYEVAVAAAEAACATARADLDVNRRSIDEQAAVLEQQKALLAGAAAEALRARRDEQREEMLLKSGAATQRAYDVARSERDKAEANLGSARAAVQAAAQHGEVLKAQIGQLTSHMKQQEAERDRARLDLENTWVRAPLAATVLQVHVRLGQFADSRASDAVVLGQLEPLHVRADIDEADIPRFRQNTHARVSPRGAATRAVDAAYVRTEPLVVPKHALSGAPTERVDTRVLQVIFAIQRGSDSLFPGQQVDLYIEAAPD